ncbi:MAG TPA: ABC transporter permease [Gemmatimonadaceae bacterium]|jgi:predicted permease
MSMIPGLRRLFRIETNRSRIAAVDDELTFHIESRIEELLRSGVCATRGEAARIAEREFGNVAEARHELAAIDARRERQARRRDWLSQLGGDMRFAARGLLRSPGFAVTAIITIALGIGATTAVFSVVDGVILKALPFTAPDQLIEITSARNGEEDQDAISPLGFIDLQRENRSFVGMAPIQSGRAYRLERADGTAIRLRGARVGSNFFGLLGTVPLRGRFFGAPDTTKDGVRGIVLAERTWVNEFGGDPGIIGRTVTLDDAPARVIGVAPAALEYPNKPSLWVPTVWEPWEIDAGNRGARMLHALARIRNAVSMASAMAELRGLYARSAETYPDADRGYTPRASPLRDNLLGGVTTPLWAILGAVALVLLIACANIANLLLVRIDARASEIAVRSALGADRMRLVRLIMVESLLIAFIGATLGVALADGAVHLFVRFAPAELPRITQVHVDATVLAFTSAVTFLASLLFAATPAIRVARHDAATALRSGVGVRSTTEGDRTRRAIVVAETALALVMVIGAGLLARSFWRLLMVDPGFSAEQVVAFDARLGKKYETDQASRAFAATVLERLNALPGVQSVAVAASRPLDADYDFDLGTTLVVRGRPPVPHDRRPEARLIPVSADYFRTLGIPLRAGRLLLPSEVNPIPRPAIVVDEEFARANFPNENPIGHWVTFGVSHDTSKAPSSELKEEGEIVGVVANATAFSLRERHLPTAYIGYGRMPMATAFLVRTTATPSMTEAAIRRLLHALDPTVAVYSMQTLPQALDRAVAEPRLYAVVLSAFAAIALLLAAIGSYGVTAYAVRLRRRELGIRLALGAAPSRLRREALRRGIAPCAVGVIIGLVAASGVTQVLRALLFGVSPIDWPTFLVAGIVLIGASAVASWLPARRAGSVDPTLSMRGE